VVKFLQRAEKRGDFSGFLRVIFSGIFVGAVAQFDQRRAARCCLAGRFHAGRCEAASGC
jgi:hypothetical protein